MIFVTSYEFYILFLFILGGAQAGWSDLLFHNCHLNIVARLI